MKVILQAKRLGLTLVEIREIISLLEGRTGRIGQLKVLRDMCAKQDELLQEQFAQIQEQVKEMRGVVTALDGLIEANGGQD